MRAHPVNLSLLAVRRAEEGSLLDLAEHLPSEAAEALLELAPGGKPQVLPPNAPKAHLLEIARCCHSGWRIP